MRVSIHELYRRSRLVIPALLLIIPVWADQPLVLTGVIAASDGGKAFAVIETADGQQRLVSVGDQLGEATVKAVHAQSKSVSLEYPDGVSVLTLSGTAFPEDYREPYHAEDYYRETGKMMLGEDQVRAIMALDGQTGALGEKAASERLLQLLELPVGTTIAGYDGQSVASTADLLTALVPVLAGYPERGNHLGVLSVADADGRRRIYLLADTAPQE